MKTKKTENWRAMKTKNTREMEADKEHGEMEGHEDKDDKGFPESDTTLFRLNFDVTAYVSEKQKCQRKKYRKYF